MYTSNNFFFFKFIQVLSIFIFLLLLYLQLRKSIKQKAYLQQQQKRLLEQQQKQQLTMQTQQRLDILNSSGPTSFPENMNDLLNNTVAPNVTLLVRNILTFKFYLVYFFLYFGLLNKTEIYYRCRKLLAFKQFSW